MSSPGLDLPERPARPDDLAACTRLWDVAIGDYVRRLNQPWFPGELAPLERLLGHLLTTDPDLFRVATRPGSDEPVAFVSANRRGATWFLSMLFVDPALQREGVGRRLLERVLPPPGERQGIALGTATDSAQPISNGLYATYGIVPRMPVWRLVGRPERHDALERLPADVDVELLAAATEAPDAVHALDRVVVGHERRPDHAFLLAERRLLAIYWRDGQPVGYGYASPSGRFGPMAALDASLLAPIGAHLLSLFEAPGAFAAWVPGAAGPLTTMLLRAGFRFDPFPMLLCWSGPLADLERYVPISGALI
ncbi:MAG: GNAT family N-acetyltransferase [Chloroflexi bacterium]|nr:GNAT family N-acetyltransferase [Chloroflexota bacterium]